MATANLSVESKDFTLPVVEATAGADGIGIYTVKRARAMSFGLWQK